ncbi:MAG TPA: HAD family hydrolase [Actinopolymorphaceae bacterium]|nr:HAD family hydrolase [Actinopolymorphaceae bacterium]
MEATGDTGTGTDSDTDSDTAQGDRDGAAPTRVIRALVFDFDGLILDTEVPEFVTWQEIFAAHGATLPLEVWAQCIGSSDHGWSPYAYLAEVSGRAVDNDAVRAARKARVHDLIAAETIMPGVEACIREARRLGVKVGLASSSSRQWVEGHLGRLGFTGEFDVLKTSDDVRRTKPDPELYLAAVAALGVEPAEAIALEDSPHGVAAAKKAGLFCVAVPNRMTSQLDLAGADLRLRSLADLPLGEILEFAART